MLSVLLLLLVAVGFGDPVLSIPGYGPWNSQVDAGYIQLPSRNALFYVLVEAEDVDPRSAPIVFWFQGGPCW